MAAVAAVEIGWRAHAALGRCGGVVHPIAALSRAIYATAGDELLWLTTGAAMHARAVRVGALPDAGRVFTVSAADARLWRAPTPPASRSMAERSARVLRQALIVLDEPAGLGALLAGRTPAFPLDHAVDAARGLASRCAGDDAEGAAAAAAPLLGLGPGLTPAGDDFVGAALFARLALARGEDAARRWRQAGERVAARAREATHPLSAVLLGDLVAGEAYAPLHQVACALAAGDDACALDAARRLVVIGHSSGWDMLAGLLGSVLGAPALGGCGRVPTTPC